MQRHIAFFNFPAVGRITPTVGVAPRPHQAARTAYDGPACGLPPY